MADQDDESALSAFTKSAVGAATDSVKSAATGAQRVASAFGLAQAPGEDNDAYAKAYGMSNSGD